MTLHPLPGPQGDALPGAAAPYPATPTQVALHYESALSGRPWANLEQIVVELAPGQISRAALLAAWVRVAARHDALRMVLRPDDALGYRLVLLDSVAVDLRDCDWSALDAAGRDRALEHRLEQDRLAGIDPEHAPAWHVTLADLGTAGALMIWTIHHAFIDATSMEIIMQDVFDSFDESPPARPPQVSFAEFAQQIAGQDKTAARSFFQAHLDPGATPAPFAAPVAPALPQSGGRMARLSRRLDPADGAALRTVAARCGATPLNLLQLAWGLVLARWTGQPTVRFGLVDSRRTLIPGLEETAGCLMATLPLQITLAPDGRLGPVLMGLRRVSVEMRRHAHADTGEIRRWIGASGNQPLFDTIVMYGRGTLAGRMQAQGKAWLSRRLRLFEEGAAAATLAFYNDPAPWVELEYDPARLPHDRARLAFGHVLTLLRALGQAAPDTDLASLDMMAPDERASLLRLGAPDTPVAPAQPCIATRFEAMAQTQPEAPALVDAASGRSLTYQALDMAANGLAWRLAAQGIGAEQIVALALPRGADHITALLAVLKTGAAVLPLDPEQPQAFLRSLISSAGARAIIAPAGSALADAAPLHLAPGTDQAQSPPHRPAPDAGRLAYVIHTSGSTGMPKGVMGLCGALSAHADAVIAAYGLQPSDRVLQFAGLAFDVALEEIVPSLLAGACLVLPDGGAAGSVTAFLDMVDRQRVSVLNLPASFWHVLVGEMAARGLAVPPPVRLLVTGSERVNPRALAQWQQIAPGVTWINGYGPTETTITCTAFTLPAHAPAIDPSHEVPIGRPLGHARAELRAFDGTLAPHGAPGRLWIGGAAVTRGYLNQPDLTATQFRPDPQIPGGRLYNTGDWAQWRADGQLQFLGRQDRQIKLNGYRIDLHQIETALDRQPEVRQAHVALDTEGGAPRLLAWVVCHETPDATDLAPIRAALARQLPGYMLPALLAVDRLPVGANGKVNTRALPRPMRSAAARPEGDESLRDPLTATIAQCMARLFDLDFVPADASFHEMGGDSLLALRLVGLIEARTGRSLRASDLYLHPTPAGLAHMLRNGSTGPRFIVPIQPEGRRPPFFAVHVLGKNEELFRPLAAAMVPDQPIYGLSVGVPRNLGEIDVQRSARVYFEEIQRHYPEGPLGLGAVSMAAYFAYELAQLLRAAGREVRVLAVLDAMGPDGRPHLRGLAKLRAHLQQFRKRGILTHLSAIKRHRIDMLNDLRAARTSAPNEVNGYTIIAANVRAVETYVPLPYEGRLSVFRAAESFWDSPEAIATGLGWASVAQGGLELHDLPGTHLSILHPENVGVLAAHLRRLLDMP